MKTEDLLLDVVEHFNQLDVSIEESPIQRTGAMEPIMSVFIRDPDGNFD
ncbi:glyoxalase [Lysinibacillus sp. NPDC097287]